MKSFARTLIRALAFGTVLAGSVPASAKVAEMSDKGFVIQQLIEVPADAEETWAMLLKPSQWWDGDHTFSGDAANLSIDPKAGGCFCEILPNRESPRAAPRGSVQHMHVVYIERPRALRMVGGLGPLQADAATATLTIQLKPGDDGATTRVMLEYVVGGYVRMPMDKMAAAVDGVLGEQVRHLAAKLGGAFAEAFPPVESAPETPAPSTVLPLPDEPPEAADGEMLGR